METKKISKITIIDLQAEITDEVVYIPYGSTRVMVAALELMQSLVFNHFRLYVSYDGQIYFDYNLGKDLSIDFNVRSNGKSSQAYTTVGSLSISWIDELIWMAINNASRLELCKKVRVEQDFNISYVDSERLVILVHDEEASIPPIFFTFMERVKEVNTDIWIMTHEEFLERLSKADFEKP